MILKSLNRKSGTREILNYLFKDKEKLTRHGSKPVIIRKNVRSRTLDKWVKEFKANEAMRLHKAKNNVQVYHTVLSFNAKDKEHITEKMLRDIAQHYMKERGEKNLYVGIAHFDHEHVHLHLVMSGTQYLTGLANRQSKAEFHRLKLSMDAYQKEKYPELINSLPRHGKSKNLQAKRDDRRERNQHIRNSQKEALLQCLELAYANSKSVDRFLEKVRSFGHEPYSRGGRITGVKFEGDRKFRFTTLGYDKEKINKLEEDAERDKQELDELDNIRNNGGKERDCDDRGRIMEDDEEPKDISDQTERDDSDIR